MPFFAYQKNTVPFTTEILLRAPYPSFLFGSCSEAFEGFDQKAKNEVEVLMTTLAGDALPLGNV